MARLVRLPLERFLQIQAASGILLLLTAAVAVAWANSPLSDAYFHVWHTPIGIRVGDFVFERSLEWFVNDVLMVIFFFVVGMEIRREIHHGELSEWRRAALPAVAALGGMLAPAAFYYVIAGQPPTHTGWGVPMATDIAFAVGILTLLGRRVPAALRVLLLALAVIDDLGAIVVIALFYSEGVRFSGLGLAALGFLGIFAMQRFGVRSKFSYILPSAVAWTGIYSAGIHPTIAGVLVGMVTPVRAWLGPEGFMQGVQRELAHLQSLPEKERSAHELAVSMEKVDTFRREAISPLEGLLHALHPWVAFGIMPLFALANAGVALSFGSLDRSALDVIAAVSVGLVLGKPVGILLACWATLRLGLSELPRGLSYRHLLVLGTVAGIGFTMALFVAQLAFPGPSQAALLGAAKLGIMGASLLAAVLGLGLGALLLPGAPEAGAARTADEAESSTTL